MSIFLHIYHHHIVLAAQISLTLSRHSSLSFIALGRSSGQHPVSSHSCWMYVRAGRPAFARPCVGIHKSTSLWVHLCFSIYIYIPTLNIIVQFDIFLNLWNDLFSFVNTHTHKYVCIYVDKARINFIISNIYIYIYIYIYI